MKIMAVDSSSTTASAALVENEKIISEFFMNAGLTHSQTLAPMIESVLNNSKTKPAEIDLFAVTNGPGSFTGLRIAAATVKAMALALKKPCVGVSSLYALSQNFSDSDAVVCTCMDARRGQLYNALFETKNGKITRLTEDRAISIENLIAELQNLNKKIELVGDGAVICYNNMKPHINCMPVPEKNRYIKASSVAFAADEIYNSNTDVSDPCTLSLNYIRVPQAERLLKENKLKI